MKRQTHSFPFFNLKWTATRTTSKFFTPRKGNESRSFIFSDSCTFVKFSACFLATLLLATSSKSHKELHKVLFEPEKWDACCLFHFKIDLKLLSPSAQRLCFHMKICHPITTQMGRRIFNFPFGLSGRKRVQIVVKAT